MYIAVTADNGVVVVVTNEQASLEFMKAFTTLRYKQVRRFVTTEKAFVDYSNGKALEYDWEYRDGKMVPILI